MKQIRVDRVQSERWERGGVLGFCLPMIDDNHLRSWTILSFFPSELRNRGSQGHYHCCGYKALTSWLMITECLALLKHWFLPHYPSSTHVRYVRTNPNGQFKFHRGQKLAKLPWHSDFREIWTLRLPQEKSYPVLQLTVLNARKCWGTLSEGNEMQQY